MPGEVSMPTAAVQQQVRSALSDLGAGDATASERLLPIVYDELRALAATLLKSERPNHSLRPTDLVHEAWLRIAGFADATWRDAAHFKAVTVRAMRRILVDHARQRGAAKRGGDQRRVTLTGAMAIADDDVVDALSLEEALVRLEQLHERHARVVELRFLAGLTIFETAHVLGVDPSTVKADWAVARAFLGQELGRG
jgi:RNA polymerase sigma factor (TIGR02999 family)